MKQVIKQSQKQLLVLTPVLQNQIKLLSLPGMQIRRDLYLLLEKNIKDDDKDKNKEFKYFKDECLIDKYRHSFSTNNADNSVILEYEETKDLRDELQDEFYLLNLTDKEIITGEYLIDSIDNEGRLDPEIDYEDLKNFVREKINKILLDSEIEKVLSLIQNLEPTGCGYRSITESLIIQTSQLECDEKLKLKVIETLKRIESGKEDITNIDDQVYLQIKNLKFYPRIEIVSQRDVYIKPDLLGLKKGNNWFVSLNDSYMPEELLAKINMNLKESNSDDQQTFKSFLTGLHRRQKTLLLVSEVIVKHQKDYLNGFGPLKPLNLNDISEKTKLSISTVSRIIKSKYLQLPKSLLLLESFIIKRVNHKKRGEDISSAKLIQIIKNIITDEDKGLPFSDEKLKTILFEKFSIEIARRTIMKYRRKAKIENSRIRKNIKDLSKNPISR